jgi:hypothetical protein
MFMVVTTRSAWVTHPASGLCRSGTVPLQCSIPHSMLEMRPTYPRMRFGATLLLAAYGLLAVFHWAPLPHLHADGGHTHAGGVVPHHHGHHHAAAPPVEAPHPEDEKQEEEEQAPTPESLHFVPALSAPPVALPARLDPCPVCEIPNQDAAARTSPWHTPPRGPPADSPSVHTV